MHARAATRTRPRRGLRIPGEGPAPYLDGVRLEALLDAHGDNISEAARAAKVDRARLYRLLWRNGLRERS